MMRVILEFMYVFAMISLGVLIGAYGRGFGRMFSFTILPAHFKMSE